MDAEKGLACALWFATRGHTVFPLKPEAKTPATRNGFKDATADPDQIRAWWRTTPYNIGLPTGHTFDVIDVDLEDWSCLESIPEFRNAPDILATVLTPRGGLHVYIPPTGRGNTVELIPGVDYRGLGGYVVAPPSTDHRGAWRFDILKGLM